MLVTPGATEDGSAILAYNSDDVTFYGFLDHYPPTQGEGGESMKVYDWETGVSETRLLNPWPGSSNEGMPMFDIECDYSS